MPSKAVIFDLYETLISEYVPVWKPQQTVIERLGLTVEAFRPVWHRLQHARFTGEIPDYATALRLVCHELGQKPDEVLLAKLQQERLELKRRPFLHIDETVLTLLSRLAQQDIPLCVLSNAASEEVAAWPESPLASFIQTTVFSCDVGLVKPDAAIYELACARLGVEPEDTLFVGDGGSDELNGAANAGLTPLWATWFVDQWPSWKGSAVMHEAASQFSRLRAPLDLMPFLVMEGKAHP